MFLLKVVIWILKFLAKPVDFLLKKLLGKYYEMLIEILIKLYIKYTILYLKYFLQFLKYCGESVNIYKYNICNSFCYHT